MTAANREPLVVSDLAHPMGARVLRAARLVAPAGSVVAVCGVNGAGKTTLLRILAGLVRPEAGGAWFAGARASPRDAVLVTQQPYLLAGSVLRNAAFGLRARCVPRREAKQRAREALAAWGLADRRDARTLSGGEAQRLAIARALAIDPALLLLDEPRTALDPPGIERVDALLRDGRVRRARTIVWATHTRVAADGFADRVWTIEDGTVREA